MSRKVLICSTLNVNRSETNLWEEKRWIYTCVEMYIDSYSSKCECEGKQRVKENIWFPDPSFLYIYKHVSKNTLVHILSKCKG